jgi:hypothetical protein
MASFVDLRQAVLFAILTLLAVPLPARSLLTTADGAEILGDVEPAEFELATDAGDVIVPCVALDHLRTLPDDTVELTLKDGKTLAGRLDTQLLITDGLIKRRLQPADVREIAFDVFVPITGESVAEVVCPIRAEVEIPADLVVGKLRTWRTSRSLLVSCDGNRLNSLEIVSEKNVSVSFAGEKPKKGTSLSIKPGVVLASGEDQFVHLTFILAQGETVLGKISHQYAGDEGELNIFAPVKLWTETAAFDLDGPPLALRFQLLTRERGTDAEPGPVFVWFLKIR